MKKKKKKKHARRNAKVLGGKKAVKRAKILKPAKSRKFLAKKVKRKHGPKKKTKLRKKAIKSKTGRILKKKKSPKRVARKVKIKKIKRPRKKRVSKKLIKKTKAVIFKKIKKAPVGEKETFSPQALFKAKIKVIGIGGGGGSIVSEFGRSLHKASFVVADTDFRALKRKPGIKYFWFGEDLTHGLGTGVDVVLAKRAAESAQEKMKSILAGQDITIFVASLGGGLGSGATQVFAEAAKNFGGITFGIFTMPFKFEGKNKHRIAKNALRNLRRLLNVSLVIPNERIFKIIDESTPILNAFSTVNKTLIESLESLIELIYNPGIINIDFADLRSILNGRGATAFLNTIEESGSNRAEKICENVFRNPLLQSTGVDAEKILFNIEGSDKLSMFEVEKISSHIAAANPKAKIIFGISKSQKLKSKIKTTILMTGGQIKESPAPTKIKKVIAKKVEEPLKKAIVAVREEKTKKKEKAKRKVAPKAKKAAAKEKKPDAGPKEGAPVPVIPAPKIPLPAMPVFSQKKINVTEAAQVTTKKAIRRSGLEIKKAEELAEKKRIDQEKEWEIPAFLRKVKFKS